MSESKTTRPRRAGEHGSETLDRLARRVHAVHTAAEMALQSEPQSRDPEALAATIDVAIVALAVIGACAKTAPTCLTPSGWQVAIALADRAHAEAETSWRGLHFTRGDER